MNDMLGADLEDLQALARDYSGNAQKLMLAADNVITVDSPEYAVILQPHACLTWFAMAHKPGITAAEGNFGVVHKHLQDNPAITGLSDDNALETIRQIRQDQAW
ncbi:hypothetical protein JOF48_002065 [Arthrobacter stackebrandtii]|uniref:Uncharacterized protein n=1 Tax=Arthrobacter stackebrandtii TaxID=272161 RepID=A0ABS4YWX5_9MICC|nr:hypothetical protein [Arthrobacter stackebrandtii]MBP2413266.1 hypothetical protein [Arthrobacter stackebrandtii]